MGDHFKLWVYNIAYTYFFESLFTLLSNCLIYEPNLKYVKLLKAAPKCNFFHY